MTYYIYSHHPGYGRHDHMAPEIIARALSYLGHDNMNHMILASMGFLSHGCPLNVHDVKIPSRPGMRRKMERALRRAYAFMRERSWAWDTYITVECYRERKSKDEKTVLEVRKENKWVRL